MAREPHIDTDRVRALVEDQFPELINLDFRPVYRHGWNNPMCCPGQRTIVRLAGQRGLGIGNPACDPALCRTLLPEQCRYKVLSLGWALWKALLTWSDRVPARAIERSARLVFCEVLHLYRHRQGDQV